MINELPHYCSRINGSPEAVDCHIHSVRYDMVLESRATIPSAASQLARSQPVPNNVASSAICSAAKVPGQSNPGISRVPVAQSTLKEIVPNITTAPIQQPSPALSACLPGTLSSLSVSALQTLEEAAMDIDDINLSVSEPLGS